LTLLQVMAEVTRESFDFGRMEKLIVNDVAISYKLLRYINSAYYRRVQPIASVRQALAYLGEIEIRRFVSMIALARLVTDKPDELIRTSFVRAKFMEKAAVAGNHQRLAPELFTVGLFSLIDALLDRPMEEIMGRLPLAASLQDALVGRQGELGDYLRLAEAYERGDWEAVSEAAAALRVDETLLPSLFLEACDFGGRLSAA
jgi:EAL and modified HD-GYP domain-containing signal transduction protein